MSELPGSADLARLAALNSLDRAPRDADGVTELCSRSTGDVEPEYAQSVLVVIDPFGREEFQDSITHWRLNTISEIS